MKSVIRDSSEPMIFNVATCYTLTYNYFFIKNYVSILLVEYEIIHDIRRI